MTLSLTLSQFLADWITGHIEGHDLRMVKFVREQQHTQTTA
jgi:hemerythrin